MSHFDTVPMRRGTNSHKWDLDCGPDVIAMSVADADFVTAPFIREALSECARRDVFGYTFWPTSARQLTVDWLERRHGWRPSGNAVLHCSGVLTGLRATLASVLNSGEAVVVTTPAYPPFAHLPQSNGYQVYDSALVTKEGRYTIDYDSLEIQLRRPEAKAMILCNPHNPVGRVYDRTELETVVCLCVRHGVTIISDEIHSDIVMFGNKHVPIASLSSEAASNTVTLVSPSKTFNIPGLPTAAVICEVPELLARIDSAIKATGNYHPDPFAVAAYEAALSVGGSYVTSMNEYLEANLQYACDFLASRCEPLVAQRPEGTYLLWIDCRDLGLADDDLRSFFGHRAKLNLHSGRLFGAEGSGFMRLNAACPRSVLACALNGIETALRTRSQERRTA
ncbi:cystathionine beta-lyase [Ensifer sp. NM-2]|uniref:MalY/PatB family protein n=1 Tax=Ensifer sp. NM-2 TaxID=2109730 RepID=UPI000D13C4CB|nr:MalY/PatB family protein [Ensifer sp. NM-2]PSS60527.1 cystathionine beta-lyase [Ensifer sp. NM-2]